MVAASAEMTASSVVDCVVNLVGKSLVTPEIGGPGLRYRLLETTRAYALEKLAESGESEGTARRHAEYFRDLFQRAAAESQTRPAGEWLAAYGLDIDNVRTALEWTSSPGGDRAISVALTVACVPLWMQLSLLGEAMHGSPSTGRIGPPRRSITLPVPPDPLVERGPDDLPHRRSHCRSPRIRRNARFTNAPGRRVAPHHVDMRLRRGIDPRYLVIAEIALLRLPCLNVTLL